MVFNIQKCSIHDGDGLRTLVFFKGCPLRCPWCANPESQSYQKEILESPARCIGCGLCRTVCPEEAVRIDMTIDRARCIQCFRCADVCFAESKRTVGQDFTVKALYEEINKDRPFYGLYGGGVTFSGGEPLTHGAYLAQIAKKCHDHQIHVMVESCGYAKYEEFEQALPYIDAMFMDVKHIDPARHRELAGADNALILENIRRIAGFGIPITIRTPIVPGYNDEKENVEGIARFAAETPGVKEYELLAYHDLGKSKYKALGRNYPLESVKAPTDEQMRMLTKYANQIVEESKIECFWMKNNKREVIK